MNRNSIQTYNNKPIRTAWDDEKEEWYFSIVDVVAVLTEKDHQTSRTYWKVLKNRLMDEGSQLVANCHQLKMQAEDGKMRLTDVGTTEQILRIIQSIPSKKAEPFKLWLAQVGKERIDETIDPELTINRALDTYLKKGYSPDWVNFRLKSIEIRKDLTNEWQKRGVKRGKEFAILTDEMTRTWSGMSTREYKSFKNLKKENLRDNMSNTELLLTMLAENATKEISELREPNTFDENKSVARRGGNVAKTARTSLEAETGKPVVTQKNANELNNIVTDLIEGSEDLLSEE